MDQEKINFPVVRDFSALFNVSVKFVKQNFKHFFQSLLFISGPFLLLTSIFSAIYKAYVMDTFAMQGGLSNYSNIINFFQNAGWPYLLLVLVGIFCRIFLLTNTYAYMIAYNQYGPGNFGVAEVRKLTFQNYGKTIKGFFVFVCLCLVVAFLVAALAGILLAASQVVASVVLVILLLAGLVISPPFIWQYSTFFLGQMKDDLDVLEAMRRVRAIMKGDYPSTWVIMLATLLIIVAMDAVFLLPQFAYQIILQLGGGLGSSEKSIPFIAISTICTFLVTLINCTFYIICGFHYYSLDEKRYGAELIKRIDEIGNTTPSNDVDQYY